MNGQPPGKMDGSRMEKLDEFLSSCLCDMKVVIEKNITSLTAPGENYWSDMLKADLKLRNRETGAIESISLCIKCVVADDFQASLNVDMFRTEIQFYKVVIPTLQDFLREHGAPEITFFPRLIGARLNLQDQGKPDKNALLILENLKDQGYQNLDRHKGFDFEAAKMIVADLAVFHAASLALKIKDPQAFKDKIESNVVVFKLPEPKDGEQKGRPPFPFELFRSIAKDDAFCRTHLDKFDKFCEMENNKFANGQSFGISYNGPFATLIHRDMWINNTMQKVKDGKVIQNLILDFQMIGVDNPAADLIFFLFTSVSLTALQNHLDFLLSHYHESFIKTLEAVGCDTKSFAYRYFLDALREAAKDKFLHTMLMNVTVIYAKKGQRQDFHKNNQLQKSDIHPTAIAKLHFMFSELVKREWCY